VIDAVGARERPWCLVRRGAVGAERAGTRAGRASGGAEEELDFVDAAAEVVRVRDERERVGIGSVDETDVDRLREGDRGVGVVDDDGDD
jgi:hypothetical protein